MLSLRFNKIKIHIFQVSIWITTKKEFLFMRFCIKFFVGFMKCRSFVVKNQKRFVTPNSLLGKKHNMYVYNYTHVEEIILT